MTHMLEIGSEVKIVSGKQCLNAVGVITKFYNRGRNTYAGISITLSSGNTSEWFIAVSHLRLANKKVA